MHAEKICLMNTRTRAEEIVQEWCSIENPTPDDVLEGRIAQLEAEFNRIARLAYVNGHNDCLQIVTFPLNPS